MDLIATGLAAPRAALLAAVPLLYLLAAWAPGLTERRLTAAWRRARISALLAGACALLSLAWLVTAGPGIGAGPVLLQPGSLGSLGLGVRVDPVGSTVLLLVCFIGWVIVRYSERYLDGERNPLRYLRALLSTLAMVSLVVITDNLLVLAMAWLGTSLALHRLLTFYGDRRPALVAAHKKFLASRLGDLCLFTAIGLLGHVFGSLEISQVLARAAALPQLPAAAEVAVVLIACAALLKCAQLPVHGWLIQVMEAPTPVSALLHAGVVNLGGFLLIRLDTLVAEVAAAQTLLVVVGSVTAVVAALVMMTRISIKVMLAWSTCAQMGFMLMQCGLGAYELALLHLVAHSLYKAHAFLSAGGAVEQARLTRLLPPEPVTAMGASLLRALGGLAMVGAAGLVFRVHPAESPALYALAGVLSFALVPLLAPRALPLGGLGVVALLAGAFGVACAYFGLHAALVLWTGLPAEGVVARPGHVAWVLLCFSVLFLVQSLLRARPGGSVARRLYPWFYAGLYLDELFTRITFRLWPVRLATNPRGSES